MSPDTRPGFLRRLYLAFVRTILGLLILIALGGGGYLLWKEVRRSFDTVTARLDINAREIESLRAEVAELSSQEPSQQRSVDVLASEIAQLDGRLITAQSELSADLERQQGLLAAIEAEIAATTSDVESAMNLSQTATDDTAALGTALVALQGDLNETNSRIDALGGEIDEARASDGQLGDDIDLLSQSVISATLTAEEIAEMRQTLALFHVWELITRARLRLAENNIGLAQADVERAFRVVDAMISDEPGEAQGSLPVLHTRLALAFNNLPGSPAAAARDLESAWDDLETILVSRLPPQLAVQITEETVIGETGETASGETTPAEATPAPTATPGP